MSDWDVRKEISEFEIQLTEYKHMVEFGPLVSDLADAALRQARQENAEELQFACAKALGRVIGALPSVLAIKDVKGRKQKLIKITKEFKNV